MQSWNQLPTSLPYHNLHHPRIYLLLIAHHFEPFLKEVMTTQYQQHQRRQSEISEKYTHQAPKRQSTRREQSQRSSESTVMSSNSTSRESAATHVTAGPAYSKKIVVVGDGGCGKTCLLISYSQGYFPEKYVPTVFENYITYPTHPASGKTVELALWDTAGQEEYDRLRPLSYPETDLLFVCFAIDCPNSLENVMDKWYPEVLHFCPYTPLVLVGLKSDLRTKRTCIDLLKTQGLTPVTQEQGMAVAQKMNARYMECSSKEMTGVEEIFASAINTVVANDRSNQVQSPTKQERPSTQPGMVRKKKRNCRFL
ncbi:Ras family protein [Phlyctema vagabunda]|uniref:Ras family protein n=1 Tax=Phlyctema vagabunda TaxID=108571 RepID=A0ABR4PGA2_9HELO